ncbi:MAG: DUF5694 domain-containing protein [Planctomycetota bacterium]
MATIHLGREVRDDVALGGLEPLLIALERFKPDVVAVERLSGETVEVYEKLAPTHDRVLDAFASDIRKIGKSAQKAVSLDRRSAETRAIELVATFGNRPGDPVPTSDRLQAALLLAAAYDLTSAALQWSYLPPERRVPDEAFPEDVADGLTKTLAARNEASIIGVALARRLQLQRVYGVDDQSDALFQLERGQELMGGLASSPEHKKLQESILFKELPVRIQKASKTEDLLGLYRWINSPEYGKADVDAQWHIFLRTRLPSNLDRRRIAVWEMRNLAIAGNIRRVSPSEPGKRVLVIIGASHKAFLDAYLHQMMDVDVVRATDVLTP